MDTSSSGATPTPVRIAFVCWIVVTLLGLIGGILIAAGAGSALFSGIDDVADESTAALTTAGIVVIVFGLVQLWLAFRMRSGANWARIVLAILGILSLTSMWGGSGGGVYNVLYLIILVAGVILMFLPANGDWFRGAAQRALG
ncbi:hypothetical protein [Tomitella fengzijianii]|uniref:Uncharacterized protein n=1 Tax=Tomitella fengzijianii TaxID=2597660 RepID=A0A516WZL9_9ACTN|nr:hypothetical protein [Tomitella fengzijianii]QDQ96306.1 hypothetical protein FO059_01785 [Tomitella fengzijianii]